MNMMNVSQSSIPAERASLLTEMFERASGAPANEECDKYTDNPGDFRSVTVLFTHITAEAETGKNGRADKPAADQ
ncbi:hypothetical protein [Kosakonia sp. BK9b]